MIKEPITFDLIVNCPVDEHDKELYLEYSKHLIAYALADSFVTIGAMLKEGDEK